MQPDPRELQFAELVVQQGLCTRDKVDEGLSLLRRLAEAGVSPVPTLGEILLRKGYLTADQLHATMTLRAGGTAAGAVELPAEAAAARVNADNLVGKYVRVERRGAGGMGEVWKAWDCELGRWTALKFLHQEDPAQVARFRREAQAAAALNHPNVAGVYEVGEARGRPFIALQYVDGPTLQAFPRSDRRLLVRLVRDAALALHQAHRLGIVHRDLKPSNLMVEGSRLYVTDFGLARVASTDSSLSGPGAVLGTPAYMPPEQTRGESSPASDVYSLGATLYELLTGRPPFQESDLAALFRAIQERDPVRPRALQPSLERDLETIVLKCLEKDPARRFASAQELADELGRWLDGEPILSHPPSWLYRARKFVARRRALVLTAGAGLAAVAATLALLVPRWLGERALKELGPRRTRVAVVREWFRQAFRTPAEIHRALEAEIAEVGGFASRHPDLPQGPYVRAQARLLLGDLDGAARDAREALRIDPGFLPAWTLLGRARLEAYVGLLSAEPADPYKIREHQARAVLDEARDALRRGRSTSGERAEIESWGLARTAEDAVGEALADALHAYYVDGRPEDALRKLEEARRAAPAEEYSVWTARWMPPGKDRALRIKEALDMAPLYAAAHAERAAYFALAGETAEALRSFSDAIERNPRSTSALISRGLVRGKTGDWDGAIADFSEALRIDPRDTSAWIYRSAARNQKGDPDGAIADGTKALEIHPESIGALCNRSIARRSRGDLKGALEDLARVHAINPRFAIAWINQAGVRQEQGDVAGALQDLAHAIGIDDRLWEAHWLRGVLRQRTGDFAGSIEDFTRAIERVPPSAGPAPLAEAYGQRSESRRASGDLEGALRDAEEAVKRDGKSGRLRAQLANVLLTRAAARVQGGDAAGAEADCTRALELPGPAAEARLLRSWARASLRRYDEAVADVDAALPLLPADSPQRGTALRWREAYRAGTLPR